MVCKKKNAVSPQTRHLFPLTNRNHAIGTGNQEKYEVLHAHTGRLMNSTVPYIQILLNREENESN